MPSYFLVEAAGRMPRWCELGDGFWIDFKARRTPYEDAKPLAVVEAVNPHDLLGRIPPEIAALERDAAAVHLLDPWSGQGWLNPEGRFYGCGYYVHDDLAYALLRRSPVALEDDGWIRVHAESFRTGRFGPGSVTQRQAATLEALGFTDLAPPGRRARWAEPDRASPRPRYAYRSRHATPVFEPPVERNETDLGQVEAYAAELLALEPFERMAGMERRVFVDFGGRWDWMIDFGDVQIGSCEAPRLLQEAVGLYLSVPGSGQIEIDEWPAAGIVATDDAKILLGLGQPRITAQSPWLRP